MRKIASKIKKDSEDRTLLNVLLTAHKNLLKELQETNNKINKLQSELQNRGTLSKEKMQGKDA